MEIRVLAVDDGSTQDAPSTLADCGDESCIRHFRILRLATNLGHQRAIAVGLVAVSRWSDIDVVLIMDSDGEDRPEEIAKLLAAFRDKGEAIILAKRSKRSESRSFRFGYFVYKVLFWLLTGARLSSGNFSVVPFRALRSLTHSTSLWNNLPATLIRSRFRLLAVPTERGVRYAGLPKMNLISLVVHGLSAISVYLDVIFVRLLISAAGLVLVAVLAILVAAAIRLFTDLATPGWATQIVLAFFIVILQAAIFIVGITLMLLAGRVQYTVIPALDWERFVDRSRDQDRSKSGTI